MNINEQTSTNNKIIRRNIISMFPAGFVYSIVLSLVFMVDMLLAGFVIGKEAIAVVAIGLPCYGMFLAFLNASLHGMELRLTWILGAGNDKYYRHSFRGGFYFSFLLSFVFFLILQIFTKPLVIGFGGAKLSAEIFPQAIMYIRFCSPMIVFFAIGSSISTVAGILGQQSVKVSAFVINLVCNVVFSTSLVFFLPQEWKLAGLGIGSSSAALIQSVYGLIIAKVKKLNMSFKPDMLTIKEIGNTFKSGLPASLDNVIDCVAAGIVNNILIAFFPTEPLIISTVAVANNIRKIGRIVPRGVGYAASTLFGVLYSERDKAGLKRSLWEALRFGFIVSTIWAVLVYFAIPFLMRLYGMADNPDVKLGATIQLIFMFSFLAVYILTVFYESTERFGMSLFVASIPDSVVYPITLAIFIPYLQKLGIWFAQSFSLIIGLVVTYIFTMIITRKVPLPLDKFLMLKEQIIHRAPMLDISISNTDEGAVGASERIQNFLQERGLSSRTAYITALCAEELAVDMTAHFKAHPVKYAADNAILDIKVFDDETSMEVIIRSMGTPYNPLDFEVDGENFGKAGVKLAQKVAEKIIYTNVYKMNIVSIVVGKK